MNIKMEAECIIACEKALVSCTGFEDEKLQTQAESATWLGFVNFGVVFADSLLFLLLVTIAMHLGIFFRGNIDSFVWIFL